MNKKLRLVSLVLFTILLTSCSQMSKNNLEVVEASANTEKEKNVDKTVYVEVKDKKPTKTKKKGEKEKEVQKDPVEERTEVSELKLACLGDVFMHRRLLWYAKSLGGEGYNFDHNFSRIKDFTSKADLTILNNEFSSNQNKKASDYPLFNTPKEIYKTFVDIGVDIVTTANNHCLDTGIEGLTKTLDNIRESGIKSTGTQKNKDEGYLIVEKNNIKLGVLSYAESLNGLDYLLESQEDLDKVNRLDPDKIKLDIENIKKAGAEFVIIYPHWGNEYESYPTAGHISLARSMAEWGADMVIGSHPHVVQPLEEYNRADGSKAIILYSLGNVMCDQNLETTGDIRTEQGVAMDIVLKKTQKGKEKKLEIASYKAHPTWIGHWEVEKGYLAQVVIASDYLEGGPKYGEIDGYRYDRLKQAYEMTNATINTKVD